MSGTLGISIPILPARDLDETRKFYEAFGFARRDGGQRNSEAMPF